MDTLIKTDNVIEVNEDVKNILKGCDDVKNNRVMDIDLAMKKFFIEKEVWKNIK